MRIRDYHFTGIELAAWMSALHWLEQLPNRERAWTS